MVRSPSHEAHTVPSEASLARTRGSGKGHSSSPHSPSTSGLVVKGEQCSSGPTFASPPTCPSAIYRCLKRRLGRTLRGLHCKRRLVRHRKSSSHQPLGVKGSFSGFKELRASLQEPDCSHSDGQHDCGILHQQTGRYEIRLSVCLPLETPVIVSPQRDNLAGLTHPRSPQRDSSGQWAVDALSLSWENLNVYAFPPISLLNQVISKVMDQGCYRMIPIAPGWPNMPWFWDLVTLSTQVPLIPVTEGSCATAFQRSSSQESQQSESACLAPRTSVIQEQGFSDEVAARIEAPQRVSTRAVYKSKWAIFVRCCESNKVDVRSPSIAQIADFLLHLFKERNLQPSTLEGYGTAIADMVGNEKLSISKDENLTRLLDSFHRDKPKGRWGVPSLDLSLVLHQLTKAPFEPMRKASLKHLTFKTVFLLALGSGKRCSEIHAWLYRNIRHQ